MYDVQPVVGEERDWIVEPLAGEIRDLPGFGECLVKRGVTNQKGSLRGRMTRGTDDRAPDPARVRGG
jgi:acetylornithine deacetylase/succinyl-diaminopimelate desuccinylase-like protein